MFVKCPKCELNYMHVTDKMCKVCYREIHGAEPPEEFELCSVCNEAPCMPGRDVCQVCFAEMTHEPELPDGEEPELPGEESVATMDEIAPGLEEGEASEYGELEGDLSLEELEEKEGQDGEDPDEDEDE